MIPAPKFSYSRAHIKKPLITPTQKTCQYIQFIGNLTDFALKGPEHFAPPSLLPWSSVHWYWIGLRVDLPQSLMMRIKNNKKIIRIKFWVEFCTKTEISKHPSILLGTLECLHDNILKDGLFKRTSPLKLQRKRLRDERSKMDAG